MTRSLLLTLSAIWITLGATVSAQESNEHILLDQLRVIVGDGNVLTNAAVLLRGDTIVSVGASADIDIPADTTRIDLAGKTLLPALIDAHAHLGYEGTSSWGAQNYTRDNILNQLKRYAYYGFGAVFRRAVIPMCWRWRYNGSKRQARSAAHVSCSQREWHLQGKVLTINFWSKR